MPRQRAAAVPSGSWFASAPSTPTHCCPDPNAADMLSTAHHAANTDLTPPEKTRRELSPSPDVTRQLLRCPGSPNPRHYAKRQSRRIVRQLRYNRARSEMTPTEFQS